MLDDELRGAVSMRRSRDTTEVEPNGLHRQGHQPHVDLLAHVIVRHDQVERGPHSGEDSVGCQRDVSQRGSLPGGQYRLVNLRNVGKRAQKE